MRGRWAALAVTAALLAAPGAAAATTTPGSAPVDLRIEQLVVEPDGLTRMTVAVSGLPDGEQVTLDQLEIVENGQRIDDVSVVDAEEVASDAIVPAVVIAMDVSGSADGPPIEAAKAAATLLVTTLEEQGVRLGVVSFGETTETLAPLGASSDAVVASLAGLEAGGGTALFDGVSRAARMLAGHDDGPRDVIVFSDGDDTTSTTSLDGLRALLAQTEVRVTSVLLQTGGVAVEPLEAMSAVNGGRLVTVESAAELGAAFASIAGDLTNRLQVEWRVEPVSDPARTLNIVATYSSTVGQASDGAQVDSPRLAAITPPREVDTVRPIVPVLAGEQGLLVAVGAGGAAVFLLLLLILVAGGERRRRGALEERLAAYQAAEVEAGRADRGRLSERATTAFDAIPRPANLDSRISRGLEHADWPMRSGEFLLLSLAMGFLGLLVGGVLLASPVAAVSVFVLGLLGPWGYMKIAISRRRAAFGEQLPTILQIIAGALRAGHAMSTALDGAVDEVDEPARSELRRASVETRLGRPLDRALAGVARRMDSEDLQWVIGAIEVQREVGGNLAEILGNVADTLRDRASVARHVKGLTAEGRLSAVFIGAMPFVMFIVLTIMNPEYMGLLFERTIGRLMLAGGVLLLLAGIVVLRRLVRPRY